MKNLATLCYWFGVEPGDLLEYEQDEEDSNLGKSIFDEVKVNMSQYLKFTEACTEWSTSTGMGYDAPEPKEEQNKKWKAAVRSFKDMKIKFDRIDKIFHSKKVQKRIKEAEKDWDLDALQAMDADKRESINEARKWPSEYRMFLRISVKKYRDQYEALAEEAWADGPPVTPEDETDKRVVPFPDRRSDEALAELVRTRGVGS